jgi:hypothetical protein
MRKLFRNFIVWAMRSDNADKATSPLEVSMDSTSTSAESKLRLGFIKAMNGTIIEISTHKHNPHGPDWKHELYIVREGENLSDAIKVILATKALEQ